MAVADVSNMQLKLMFAVASVVSAVAAVAAFAAATRVYLVVHLAS